MLRQSLTPHQRAKDLWSWQRFGVRFSWVAYLVLRREKRVVIATGAVSVIGLSLTRQFLHSGWRVAMADVQEEKGRVLDRELSPNMTFKKANLANYGRQAVLFLSAFEWGGRRLDLFAANASIFRRIPR